MLAGGTGISPMYQVLQAILKNPNDKTQVGAVGVAVALSLSRDLAERRIAEFPAECIHSTQPPQVLYTCNLRSRHVCHDAAVADLWQPDRG